MSGAISEPTPKRDLRLAALRRFAVAITVLNTLGHTVLGFESSLAQMFVALATAYSIEIALELAAAWAEKRSPAFAHGPGAFIDFLLPPHISALAISMLLFAGDRLLPFAFAAAVAITSKALFVAPIRGRVRHFLNPSNTGLVATIFAFPSTAITPPYHFTENLTGIGDWMLPALIICTGTLLNARFTHRMPLILSWLAAFAAQAYVRHLLLGTWVLASLAPMTGVAYILFTFYMISDPGTTPTTTRGQVAFGLSLGLAYGLVMTSRIVFPAFVALFVVCAARGLLLHAARLRWVFSRRQSHARVLSDAETQTGRPAVV